MRVSRPLDVYGLAISRFAVRTADNRGDLNLPPDPDADPDEVVIMGSRQRARFELTLGLDRMSLCSRLVWDNRTRILTLHCSNLVTSG